ncbi:hypothetical protein [Parasitella parasitica]|uniref:Uncharacterized protein n=1 Tax=Parasitella parasitica TaxID=35722 RepID=A0A0B7NES7_9FUNG|nr:hypothetical protein [Parasitella parasitica]
MEQYRSMWKESVEEPNKPSSNNACYNTVDCHAPKNPNKIAIIREGDEPADVRHIIYGKLLRDVCRINPLPGCTPTKAGPATHPFFGIQPVLLDPASDTKIDKADETGVLAIKSPWPPTARSIYQNHSRFIDTYVKGLSWQLFHRLKPHANVSDGLDRDLVLTVRKIIGPFATPKRIHIVREHPKTCSSEIVRRILRKIINGEHNQLGDTSTLADLSVFPSIVS